LLALASLTDSLVKVATNLIGSLGLGGVALLCATSGVIGLPGSEPTMLFAGFNVYQGRLSLLGIIALGVVGDMVGASIAYLVGYYGRRELVERQGAKLHMSAQRLDRAESHFERRGAIVILLSRLVPFVRAAFPYAAGVMKIPFGRFFALATAGSILWIGALGVLGREVGGNWQSWRHHLEYADYAAVALLVLAIVYFLVRRNRSRTGGSTPAAGGHSPRQGDSEQTTVDVVGK
jgi:membrane protein DedA with SNARE-associated domain